MSSIKIAVTLFTLAFRSPATPVFHQAGFNQPAKPKLVSWRGATGDLSVDLKFEQSGDSIYGRGTYKVGPKKRVGCGGETLPTKGYFTMRASGTQASFRGRFMFDSGWMPPVSGTKTSNGSIRVSIRSVDRGPCIMTLEKWQKVS